MGLGAGGGGNYDMYFWVALEFLVFYVILGSFSVLVLKWLATQKRPFVEHERVKFGTQESK